METPKEKLPSLHEVHVDYEAFISDHPRLRPSDIIIIDQLTSERIRRIADKALVSAETPPEVIDNLSTSSLAAEA